MQKIQTISKTKKIDYGNEEVNNFWLKINEKSNFQKDNNNLKQICSVFNEIQNSFICIQTEKLDHPEIIEAIFNASKKRNRIYILTNEKDKQLQQFEGVCLIRYGIKNIGSFILVNPNTNSAKGILYTAPFIETSLANSENISLELDNGQLKTLFRFFSDNFWNKAEFEIIEDFNNPKETGEPPLDFLPNIKDFCDADFVKNEIYKINNNAIISIPSLQTNDIINFTKLKNSKIITGLKNNNTELLKSVKSLSNSIYAFENNFSRIIITENGSWLMPKTNISKNDNFYSLKLNATQIKKLNIEISEKLENAEFGFNLSKTREELENETIRLLDNIENEIKSETEITAKNIELTELLPKEEFEKQEPEFVDDGISVKINYSWQIIPFYTPNNAKKAKLYQEWEKHQNEYNNFVNQIEEAINESENKKIAEKLKRWFLGKKQTISKYQQELEAIKEINLSVLEATKRKDVVNKVNELAKKVSANLFEIDNEIKKSAIKIEIEQLKKQKEEKETKLEKFIEEQERLLKEKENNKEQLINDFLEKYNLKKDELPKHKSEWKRKKNKKKEKIAEDQKKLEELKEIEGFNFRNKFEDDKQKIEKEIKSIENKIDSKEKQHEKAGKEQQQNEGSSLNSVFGKGQNNKKSKQNNEFSIPDIEYLPKIGELFEVGKQKYLEIEFWEDFELGQTEIQRLNAKLSAKNNS
jgi:hypothetical protein